MLVNFRELGGVPTMDGRLIKKGMLYRSGLFFLAGRPEINYLNKLGINTVFDYRGDNNFGNGFEFAKNVYSISASDHLPTASQFNESYKMSEDESMELMKNFYRYLPFDSEAYRNMVSKLEDPTTAPLVQCCTAGKDRTGIGSIIVMWILGVSKEEIYKHHLKTEEYMHEIINSYLELLNRKFDWDMVGKIFKSKISVELRAKPEFLDALYDEVESKYGTIDSYLQSEFGLNEEIINRIKDIYLD